MQKQLTIALAVLTASTLMLPTVTPAFAQTQSDAVTPLCYTFNNNLGEGRPISPSDAQALTVALINTGVWNEETPISVYNDAVASAVSGFQEKYASQILAPNGLSYGTGFIGASTRAKLNSLYGGCSNSPQPIPSSQCPAGYTCTPIGQVPVCPAGYTCTPINSTASFTTPSPAFTPAASSLPSNYTSSNSNESASLSIDATTPGPGSTTQTSSVPILIFDVLVKNTSASLTNLGVRLSTSGAGSVTGASLYEGGKSIGTGAIIGNTAQFNGLTLTPLSPGYFYPFTVEINTNNAGDLTVAGSVMAASTTVEDTSTQFINVNGSAAGNPVTITAAQTIP